jgi:hypothetical protein
MRISIVHIALLAVASVIFLSGVVPISNGQTGNQFPIGLEALLPPGAKMKSRTFNKNAMMGVLALGASKHVVNNAVDTYTDYGFGMTCFEEKFWKIQEQNYRAEQEHQYRRDLKDATAQVCHYSGRGSGSETCPPALKVYPWGKAFTQRTDHHEESNEGPKAIFEYTTYLCRYYGVTKCGYFGITVRECFDLTEADQFAAGCSNEALKYTLSTFGK